MVKSQIIPGLVISFNNSINEGTFPEMPKIAKVIPVYKKNGEFVTRNYAGINFIQNHPPRDKPPGHDSKGAKTLPPGQ